MCSIVSEIALLVAVVLTDCAAADQKKGRKGAPAMQIRTENESVGEEEEAGLLPLSLN